MKIDKSDWDKVPVDPDPNFSAEHNKRVIDRTIRKYEANRKKKAKEFDAKLKDRTAAVAQYLKSVQKGSNKSAKEYFGKKELARLRGEEAINELKYAKEKTEGQEAGVSQAKLRRVGKASRAHAKAKNYG